MADVTLNLHVDAYTNRVLGVIKEAFGLKNKSEALRKFTEMYGQRAMNEHVSPLVAHELDKLRSPALKSKKN